MTAPAWSDLSDVELRTRLINRGMETELAIALVARRETEPAEVVIAEWLA